MTTRFKQRGYPERILTQPTTQNPTTTIQRPTKQVKPPRLPFINTYHPIMPKIHGVIRHHWPLLQNFYSNVPEFHNPPMICTKRPKNLRDTLIRADIGPIKNPLKQSLLDTKKSGTFPCLHCTHCSNVIKGDSITHPLTGERIPIKGFHTCDTTFAIYLLKCPCGLIYVGETSQKVKNRITSHKSTIRCKKTWLPVPHHFEEANHNIAQLRYQILEHIPRPRRGGNHIKLLKQRESYWIHRLNSLSPNGLNRDFDFMIT